MAGPGGELERVPGVGTAVAVAATLVVTVAVAVTVVRPVTHQAQHGGNHAVGAREARFSEPITARDVASAVGRSPGHVTTVVRRRTGRTVGRWVTERRLQEARRLLASTDLTVAAVATRVGYRDPGYFIRRFRAAHDLTPQEWRRAG